jgi:hypothetical protein
MLQAKVVEKIETHLIFNNFFFNCAAYELMLKNVVESDRPHVAMSCDAGALHGG